MTDRQFGFWPQSYIVMAAEAIVDILRPLVDEAAACMQQKNIIGRKKRKPPALPG